MDYLSQLKEFFGATVSEDEARQIARAVIAGHVRQLKVAMAQQVWQARRRSGSGDQAGGAESLAQARVLKQEYDESLDQYACLGQAGGPAETGTPQRDGVKDHGPVNERGPVLRLVTPEVAG